MNIKLLVQRMVDGRARRGWPQPRLAKESRTDKGTINEIETGRRRPHKTTVTKIAKALEFDPAELEPA